MLHRAVMRCAVLCCDLAQWFHVFLASRSCFKRVYIYIYIDMDMDMGMYMYKYMCVCVCVCVSLCLCLFVVWCRVMSCVAVLRCVVLCGSVLLRAAVPIVCHS